MDPVGGGAGDGGGDHGQGQVVEPDVFADRGAAAVAFGQQVATRVVEEVDAAACYRWLC